MRGSELLTPEQRQKLMSIPADISEHDLGVYYMLQRHDLEFIRTRRRDTNRLGVAIQICVLRHLGWSLPNVKHIPDLVISYVAKQINVDPSIFPQYARRENTLYDHLVEIREAYGYTLFSPKHYLRSLKYLLPLALENDDTNYLIQQVILHLKRIKPYIWISICAQNS